MNIKSSGLGILLVVISLLGFWFIVVPQIKTYGANVLDLKAKTTEAASYDQRVKDLDTLQQKGDAFQSVINSLQLAMPKNSQLPESLVMIQAIGNNSGINFSGVSLGASAAADTTTSGSVSELPVALSFTGSLGNVQSFLDALRANVREAVVDSQQIKADADGNISATINIGLVYQGEQ